MDVRLCDGCGHLSASVPNFPPSAALGSKPGRPLLENIVGAQLLDGMVHLPSQGGFCDISLPQQ